MNMNMFLENSWFAFSVVAIAVMIFVGSMQYTAKEFRLYRRYNWKFFRFVAVILGITFTVLLVKDSGNGIIQLMDNFLVPGEDDPAWSVILMLMAVSISGCAFSGILYVVGTLMGKESRKTALSKIATMRQTD